MSSPALLELRGVSAGFEDGRQRAPILVDLSFTIGRSEIVGLVGESGSGKSMTARAVMSSLPAGIVLKGDVLLDGKNMGRLSAQELRATRARVLGVIFQDARLAVDPLWTI